MHGVSRFNSWDLYKHFKNRNERHLPEEARGPCAAHLDLDARIDLMGVTGGPMAEAIFGRRSYGSVLGGTDNESVKAGLAAVTGDASFAQLLCRDEIAGMRWDAARWDALDRLWKHPLNQLVQHYVHLMDGGISDNLALRSLSNALIGLDEDDATLRRIASTTRRVIVISVDGQAATDPTLGQQRIVTGLGQIFSAVSGTQIDAYSFETLLLANQQVQKLTQALRRIRCETSDVLAGHDCSDVKGELIHISLAGIQDAAQRERLQAIRTGLTISDADVDALVDEGEALIQTNPTLLGLISDLDGRPVAAVTPR